MPGPLIVSESVTVPERELSWRFSRSSGPGGQSVNTTDSRVELTFSVATSVAFSEAQRDRALARLAGRLVDGAVTVTASEHRSQLRNREVAERRLAQLLREAIAPPRRSRRPTKPTRGSVQRRLDAKRRRGEVKRLRQSRADP